MFSFSLPLSLSNSMAIVLSVSTVCSVCSLPSSCVTVCIRGRWVRDRREWAIEITCQWETSIAAYSISVSDRALYIAHWMSVEVHEVTGGALLAQFHTPILLSRFFHHRRVYPRVTHSLSALFILCPSSRKRQVNPLSLSLSVGEWRLCYSLSLSISLPLSLPLSPPRSLLLHESPLTSCSPRCVNNIRSIAVSRVHLYLKLLGTEYDSNWTFCPPL